MLNQLHSKILRLIPAVAFLLFQAPAFAQTKEIRVGYFPNVTHAPALIARARGHFEKKFGNDVTIQWKTFNAGPEAMEALFAGALDILYVGPNPAINGYVRSKGEVLRVLAGVASGGGAFVIRPDSGITKFEDIRGKRVASPQKGNTQDVSLHHLMHEKGLVSKSRGGDVEVFNISGGDQITAFLQKQVDAIWTVEPWVSRLTSEGQGKVLFEESELWPGGKYPTTVLVGRKKFLNEHPDWVQEWVKGHVEILHWIQNNISEAKEIFNEELRKESGEPLPSLYLENAFGRINFSPDPLKTQVLESARRAGEIGYLKKNELDLTGLYELSFLNNATEKKKGNP